MPKRSQTKCRNCGQPVSTSSLHKNRKKQKKKKTSTRSKKKPRSKSMLGDLEWARKEARTRRSKHIKRLVLG